MCANARHSSCTAGAGHYLGVDHPRPGYVVKEPETPEVGFEAAGGRCLGPAQPPAGSL